MNTKSLTLGWLYPDLMSTYGDRGNVIVLKKRAEWRGVEFKVKKISVVDDKEEIKTCDIFLMGGAQDTQQEIVNKDLDQQKGSYLKQMLNDGIPGLFICGAYQFLGNYYKAADGTMIKGVGFFDLYTENPGLNHPRLIGNMIFQPTIKELENVEMVGFENHGGRTYLSDNSYSLATPIKGFGNNGKDQTEGIYYKHAIGTYSHGPILPKNPELADFLLSLALEMKYKEKVTLQNLDNSLEQQAREAIKARIIK